MARVTIKKTPKGYQVSLFRKRPGSKEIVKDNLGTFRIKSEAQTQAKLARKLVR